MSFLITAFIFLATATTLGEVASTNQKVDDEISRVKRLIGGVPVDVSEWPWLVSLRGHVPTQYFWWWAVRYADVYCGGAIIHRRWILTAAHCFYASGLPEFGSSQTRNWYVKAGDGKLTFNFRQRLCAIWNRIVGSHNYHCWYIPVEKVLTHPQFSAEDNWRNDIALVKLDYDLPLAPLDESIDTVNLPNVTAWPPTGTDCSIQGWGCTVHAGPLQQDAHNINIPTLDDSQCSSSGQSTIGPNRLCAGYRNRDTGLCKGDSGGPLVCRDTAGIWRQAGIASFTSSRFPGDVPGVFTRVSQYLAWINDTIAANS